MTRILLGPVGAIIVLTVMYIGFDANSLAGTVVLLSLSVAGLALYFLPAIVANRRGHPATAALTALNLLLGWTLIGWVAALVWALMPIDNNKIST